MGTINRDYAVYSNTGASFYTSLWQLLSVIGSG